MWDTDSHRRAVVRARLILATWSQPKLPYERWWAELKTLLTPEAQESYSFTDPSTVPELTLTGAPREASTSDPFVDTVYFTTSDGTYGVDLSRASIRALWMGESIIFPGGESVLQ